MTELFTQLTIPLRTWDETIAMGATEGNPQGADQASGGLYIGGRYVGGTMEGASYRSSVTGARFEILPEDDLTIGCVAYDDAGTEVFKVLVTGTDKGDVIIGNYAGGQGAMWDDSAATFSVKGTFTASEIHIPDTATANSFHVDSSGNTWWGAVLIADATAKVLNTGAATFTSITITGGVIDGTSTIGGRLASVLNTAIDASGHFADSAISTATSTILGAFTFGVSGALQIGTYVNGVSGDIKISPTGILGRDSAGATTFSINGTTGVAVLNGLVVGTNVGLGTAQDSAGVTTIVGNVVTTGFVNALNVNAATVSASISITTPTITGGTMTIGTGNSVFIAGANGIQLGHTTFGSAPFSVSMAGALIATSATITGGVIDGTSTIGGRLASVLNTAIDASGHFADSAISTATSTIITPFTFGVSGALQIGTYEAGVTGDVRISPTGILGRDKNNATTFSINATTGVAVLNGLVVGTNVGLGTAKQNFTSTPTTPYYVGDLWSGGASADLKVCITQRLTGAYNAADWGLASQYQSATQVTTIVGNTVTTGFVNALSVVAGSVAAENITGTTITGKTVQTAATGQRVIVDGVSNLIEFFDDEGNSQGTICGIVTGIGITGNIDAGSVSITCNNIILNEATGAAITVTWNNSVDLGESDYRFRDLFLGGTAYLGGKVKLPVGTNLY